MEGATGGGHDFGWGLGVDGCGRLRGENLGGDCSGCLGDNLAGSGCGGGDDDVKM